MLSPRVMTATWQVEAGPGVAALHQAALVVHVNHAVLAVDPAELAQCLVRVVEGWVLVTVLL